MKSKHAFIISFITLLVVISGLRITICTASSSSDGRLEIVHDRTFGGTNVEYNYAMINASDGGYIMAGHTSSFGAGASDAWILRVDIEGNHLWNCTYGGTDSDVAISIISTPDGGYALTGVTESFGLGGMDIWVIKIDSLGQHQWNRTFGGSQNDYGGSLVLAPDGGYVICGYTESFGLGERDFYVVKTDDSGNMVWNKTYGGSNSERGSSIIVTADGGFLLIGLTETYTSGSQDFWIVKTDSNGNQLWNRTFGGSNNDSPYGGILSSDGSFVITGKTRSFGAGNEDAWLIKIDQDGSHEWNHTFGGLALDYTTTIIPTKDDGYVLAGRTMSFGSGGEDFWLIKTNSLGELEFDQTFGGSSADAAYGIVENGDEGFSLTGRTGSYGAGADDIWFITVIYVNKSIDGFTTSITLAILGIFVIVRVKFSKSSKKSRTHI